MREIIYDNTRSELENFLFQLGRLEEQGYNLGQMPDVVFQRLIDLIDAEKEIQLQEVRGEIKELCQAE